MADTKKLNTTITITYGKKWQFSSHSGSDELSLKETSGGVISAGLFTN